MFNKIINTIFVSIFIILVIYLGLEFYNALTELDDDMMFVMGLTLASFASVVTLLSFFVKYLVIIWYKKDNLD